MPRTRARLLVQRADFSDFERQQILEALASPPSEGILLFAVSGGMYAEGVDYPGELLSGVFVVSPALPQVSFERELLRRYFDEREEAGFDYAYLQPGMTRVVQAAGRLIRSETDRGVIALDLPALPRETLRPLPAARLVRRHPGGARHRPPRRGDPRVLRELRLLRPLPRNERFFQGQEDAPADGGHAGSGPAGQAAARPARAAALSGELGTSGRLLRVRGDHRGVRRAGDAGGDGRHGQDRRRSWASIRTPAAIPAGTRSRCCTRRGRCGGRPGGQTTRQRRAGSTGGSFVASRSPSITGRSFAANWRGHGRRVLLGAFGAAPLEDETSRGPRRRSACAAR